MHHMKKSRKIAVAVERSSAYGRKLISGVAEIAELHPDWDLTLIDPLHILNASDEFDGWICRVINTRTARVLAHCGKPVVDCLCATTEPAFASVKTDAEQIGNLAAEHLIKHRFHNFAFCGYRHVGFSDRRRNAFSRFLERNGIRPTLYRPPLHPHNRFGRDFLLGDRVESPPDAEDLVKWLKRLPKPVGVFCCDDLRASHLVSACRLLKLSVPSDVAILGVDDDPIYCMFSTPRLSSIDPDPVAIGQITAKTLAKMLSDEQLAGHPPTLIVPPRGVIERASTNTYPYAPPWFAEALDFIRSNAIKGISASDVFRHVGFSRTLVERVFNENISSPVQKKIVEARIDEAKRLLSTTSIPVKEIATLSGFSSLYYLSRAFASATGLPPTAWREQNTT